MHRKLLVFSLLVLTPLVALGLDEEAGFFAASGETVALSNFTHEGNTYYLLKINGEASVILQGVDGSYAAVTDEAQLNLLVPSYLKTQALPFDATTLAAVRANFDLVNKDVGVCVEGVKAFYSCTTPPPFACAFMWISILPDYPAELGEIKKMDVAYPGLRQGMSDLGNATVSLESSFAANDLDGVSTSASTMFNAVAAIQSSFGTVASAYSIIKPVFPYSFDYWNNTISQPVKANCTTSTTLTGALNQISSFASTTKALSATDTLNKVKTTTLARNSSASARRLHFFKAEEFKPVSQKARTALTAFGSAGLVVTAFNNELSQITALLESIRNASTIEEAQSKASEFDSRRATFSTKTDLYASLATEYNASVVAKANASAQISKASRRYGANSDFVSPLQKKYTVTSNSLKTFQEKLAAGQAVSLADLQQVTANYTDVINVASELKPRESQIDYVVIGGIVVVVLAVIGAVVYFKKRPPMIGKSQKIIDIRKLPPEKSGSTRGPAIEGPPWVKRL